MIKLVVTDLDDTLFSWTNFFVQSFYEMTNEVLKLVDVDQQTLLEEYRIYNVDTKNIENIYSTLELPCVKSKYHNLSKEQLENLFAPVFEVFEKKRNETLKLYDNVEEYMKYLKDNNIKLIGYSESIEEYALYRLNKLDIYKYFDVLYLGENKNNLTNKDDKVKHTNIKKPNKDLLNEIIKEHNFSKEEVIYVGDSLEKDMFMAKETGLKACWCNVYLENKNQLVNKLIPISHWDEEETLVNKVNKEKWNDSGYKVDYEFDQYNKFIEYLTLNK